MLHVFENNLILLTDVINYTEKMIDIGGSIISAIVSSIISTVAIAIILKHYLIKQRQIGKRLSSEGIRQVGIGKSGITEKDWNDLLKLAKGKTLQRLEMCFLTGRGFLIANRNLFVDLLKQGVDIHVMLASPRGQFLSETYEACKSIEALNAAHEKNEEGLVSYYTDLVLRKKKPKGFLESAFVMLESGKYQDAFEERNEEKIRTAVRNKLFELDGEHIFQVNFVKLKLLEYQQMADQDPDSKHGRISLSYYSDEYRVPIVLLHVRDQKQSETAASSSSIVWTNLCAPTLEAENAVRLYGVSEGGNDDFVNAMVKSMSFLREISEQVF